ncbi:MAG: right-handed parallel beta-helix repeat-containing protein [Treponema sp.]|nr:right-handed parallel beta-helix repeat-containing protein [Treponema sp.]
MEYHVSKNGSDENKGSIDFPFLTIQHAADLARPGDSVIVHEGEYREWVNPKNAGKEFARIVYAAAENEKVVIKGSEKIDSWEKIGGGVWKAVLPDSFFGDFNPFVEKLAGDWLEQPKEYSLHLGNVYLNGKCFYEVPTLDEVKNPAPKTECKIPTWDQGRDRHIDDVDSTLFVWFSEHDDKSKSTIIYANFQNNNPNEELCEINVRKCCFFPEKTGVDYITVSGFEMAQAACQWAPPTAMQYGLLGCHWSKGWIIENNIIHDAKCSGISLGKEITTGHNDFSNGKLKPGYQYQMEAVFRARHIGWSKERIGGHIVRGNKIYDCGQNGIVGHLGCVFSQIYGNEIFNIATRYEFFGYEIAGIKLHAAIDVEIRNNYIHSCTLGTWLDWEAQGTRVSANVYDKNNRDLMIEVSHGPCLVDNNIFTSDYGLNNGAQGNAYIHNLWCGFVDKYPVIDRTTPYHLPHSTEILGTAFIYGDDDRWFRNIFVGKKKGDRFYTEEQDGKLGYGTAVYNGCPADFAEYMERIESVDGDHQRYFPVKQPAYIDSNAYFNGAKSFDREKNYFTSEENPNVKIDSENENLFLEIDLPEDFVDSDFAHLDVFDCDTLEVPRLSQQRFDNPDGKSIILDKDIIEEKRGDGKSIPGPLQNLKAGHNRVKIWETKKARH